MAKYKITNAMVDAAHAVLKNKEESGVPDNYFSLPREEQIRYEKEAMRAALIAAAHAGEDRK